MENPRRDDGALRIAIVQRGLDVAQAGAPRHLHTIARRSHVDPTCIAPFEKGRA